MIRGGEGHNARIREEAKAKDDLDREWLLDQVNEILAREEARWQKVESPPANPNYRPDETDDVWASRWDEDWERSEREYHRFMHYE